MILFKAASNPCAVSRLWKWGGAPNARRRSSNGKERWSKSGGTGAMHFNILQHIAWWLFIYNMWCIPFNSDAVHLVTVLIGTCFSFFICQDVFPSVRLSKEKILVQLPLQRCREVHLEGGVGWRCWDKNRGKKTTQSSHFSFSFCSAIDFKMLKKVQFKKIKVLKSKK